MVVVVVSAVAVMMGGGWWRLVVMMGDGDRDGGGFGDGSGGVGVGLLLLQLPPLRAPGHQSRAPRSRSARLRVPRSPVLRPGYNNRHTGGVSRLLNPGQQPVPHLLEPESHQTLSGGATP